MPMKRCEEKRKEWPKHWQCDSEVPGVEDKSWESEELRSLEGGLPQGLRRLPHGKGDPRQGNYIVWLFKGLCSRGPRKVSTAS